MGASRLARSQAGRVSSGAVVEVAAADAGDDHLHRARMQGVIAHIQLERRADLVRALLALGGGENTAADDRALCIQQVERTQTLAEIGIDQPALQA